MHLSVLQTKFPQRIHILYSQAFLTSAYTGVGFCFAGSVTQRILLLECRCRSVSCTTSLPRFVSWLRFNIRRYELAVHNGGPTPAPLPLPHERSTLKFTSATCWVGLDKPTLATKINFARLSFWSCKNFQMSEVSTCFLSIHVSRLAGTKLAPNPHRTAVYL